MDIGIVWGKGAGRAPSPASCALEMMRPQQGAALTPEPRPQPVVVAIQEPVQDPGEDGDVVILYRAGWHLRKAFAQRNKKGSNLY